MLHAPPWKCVGKKQYLLTIAVQHGGGVDLHISREKVPASARVLAKLIHVPPAVTLVPETKPQPGAPAGSLMTEDAVPGCATRFHQANPTLLSGSSFPERQNCSP